MSTRKPMSQETKDKIAAKVRQVFAEKRLLNGDIQTTHSDVLTVIPECVRMKDLTFDPKLFQPIRERCTCKRFAVFKSSITNTCNAVGKCDGFKGC